MKTIHIVIIIIIATLPSFARAEYSFIGNILTKDNVVYQNIINEKYVLSMPSWSLEEGEPPLSMQKAVESARNYVRTFLPEYDDSIIASVKLHPLISPYYFKDKWCYYVTFERANEPKTQISILVMMDGTIPEMELAKK